MTSPSQVLTQSRRDLIETSFASLEGAQPAIVHLYNAVSPAWRQDRVRDEQRRDPADRRSTAPRCCATRRRKYHDTDWRFEYSPETFSTAELEFSVEVCAAVMDVLQPTPDKPIIFNLPATVECATPNIYADQIELFGRIDPEPRCAW